jgi:RNA recognition motif-containing protein
MLSHHSTEDDIRQIFAPFGALIEVVLLRQKDETAASRGIAFVKYREKEAADRAIQALDRRFQDKVSQLMSESIQYTHSHMTLELTFVSLLLL